MTASRIIRGTRAKIVLYVCGIFIITAIIACYNNTLSQLDDARRASEICRQQEENLSTQLQVISDYKVRIEKSLKAEKADHQQTKIALENQLNEEKTRNEKSFGDVKIKFSSLQQHYNILQTEHEDYKEECSRTQQKQQEVINNLQSKIEELGEELKKVKASKESLKTEYIELQVQKENLDKQLRQSSNNKNENESEILHLTKENEDMKQELQHLREKCSFQDTLQEPGAISEFSSPRPKISSPSDNNFLDKNNVLKQPSSIQANIASSKSTTKSGFQPSLGALDNAKPLLLPTVTPESSKPKVLSAADTKKLPQGVVAFPEKKSEEPQIEIKNNRYQNVNDQTVGDHKEPVGKEEAEDGAHEVFDPPPQNHNLEGIGFGEVGENQISVKEDVKKSQVGLGIEKNKDKKNQDNEQQDYKELQLENEEDDDAEGYEDHLARQKDPAVRN